MREVELLRLGDEIELAYGKSLPAGKRRDGTIAVFGSNGQVGVHNESAVDGPGIIVGRKGSVGEVKYCSREFWPIDTTYYVVNPKGHHWRYLFHLLRHCGLTELNSHSAVPGLNREDVYNLEGWLPDPSTQSQIANVLDFIERSGELERRAKLLTASLKQAVMGDLFSKGLRGEPQRESELGPIPASWTLARFSETREWLQYGTSTRCTSKPVGRPVLRIPNIKSGGVDATDLKYCDLPEHETGKYQLEHGDLLFIRTNGVIDRLGSCAVYTGQPAGALFASYLIRARPLPNLVPKFAAYFFGSERGTSLVAGSATPAADGKYNLNTGTIDALSLPLPPTREEQQEIVDVIDALERKIDLHHRRGVVLDDLYKAVLHKLMTGEVSVEDFDLSALPAPEEALV